MTIYVDNGKSVTIYLVKVDIEKAVMTEMDNELAWSGTYEGYGVTIVDKTESNDTE